MPTSDSLTLREALDEYYAQNPGFNGVGDFLGQPRETVIGHDVLHVLFDLGPTSEEELIVETVTLLGWSPRMVRAAYKLLRMKKRWPHFGYQDFMDMRLKDIRKEFGIVLPF